MRGGKRRKRDHLPRRIPYVELLDVAGQHAVGGVRLQKDPLDPAPLNEVIDIAAAEGRRQGVMDGGDGHPQDAGPFPVHIDPVFGHILHAVGSDLGQARVF